ncbi:MAG: hypothetical protein L3K19_00175 [Thermoplasmata archaeon]|nr:hypothetical protein [Thermoplasmata archaeon]
MAEYSAERAFQEAKKVVIADIGSIVQYNELLAGRDATGQILALSHRAHPDAVRDLLNGYQAGSSSTACGNLSAFVGYWVRKARADVHGYVVDHPFS